MKNVCEIFGNFITENDVQNLESSNGLIHPLKYLLSDDNERLESNGYYKITQCNTQCAVRIIEKFNNNFLKKRKSSLIGNNAANASGALGEIRCYGLLLSAFGETKVHPLKEQPKHGIKTPDFKVEIDEHTIYIEANTLQINEDEGAALVNFERSLLDGDKRISIGEHTTQPFGIKKQSGTTPSVIRKLCSVKQKGEQLEEPNPSILWIDCQDEYTNILSERLRISGPIFSGMSAHLGCNGVWTNEIWYSLYGKNGMSIFDGETLNYLEGKKQTLQKMTLDGKFTSGVMNNISAVIINGVKDVVAFENPNAVYPVPECFFETFSSCNNFRLESSRINFPDNNLLERLKLDYELIDKLCEKTFYSW